jgi:TPR repeat protein
MQRFLFFISSVLAYTLSGYVSLCYADTETLDANQHVIMFEKGVDSFMAGDYEKCDDYWLPLAQAGDFMAVRNMALLYHKGIGVRQDLEEAELFYRLAADNGITSAQTTLGTLLIKGDEFKRNLPDAVKYLTAASQAGDSVASWNLGLLYENGIGVDKNLEKAMSLFHTAARGGYEPAIIRISGQQKDIEGHNGYAPPQNIVKAVNTTLKDSSFNKREQSVIPEEKTFLEKKTDDIEHDKKHFSDQIHFQKSLQSDDPSLIFKHDRGEYKKVQVGIDKELDPFGIASSKKSRVGEALNRDNLSDNAQFIDAEEAYRTKNYKRAEEIWQTLLNTSTADEAAYRLGKMYFDGVGVAKDLSKTYAYWKKGADAGGEKSTDALEAFRASMTDTEFLAYEQKTL